MQTERGIGKAWQLDSPGSNFKALRWGDVVMVFLALPQGMKGILYETET